MPVSPDLTGAPCIIIEDFLYEFLVKKQRKTIKYLQSIPLTVLINGQRLEWRVKDRSD